MITLSIDTSVSLSVALFKENQCLKEITEEKAHVVSEKCATTVQALLNEFSIQTIDLIVLNVGPGSFTGLRVGLSFVLGLAFGKATKLISMNALEILLHTQPTETVALLESKRDEVYYSENGTQLEAYLKTNLSEKNFENKSVVVHRIGDLATYLPNVHFIEKPLTATALFFASETKRTEADYTDPNDLDAVYIKSFAGSK